MARNTIKYLVIFASLLIVATLSACNMKVDKGGEGKNKNVEISTPFGDLKVRSNVEAKDTGMPLYPGAHKRESRDNDSHAANVQIGSDKFGVKVIAAEFESNDSPDKLLSYYKNELKSFGSVLECKGGGVEVNGNWGDDDDKNAKELTCGKDTHGKGVELKAGTPDRQHIVHVEPNGSGSRFALVYVQKRGREGTI